MKIYALRRPGGCSRSNKRKHSSRRHHLPRQINVSQLHRLYMNQLVMSLRTVAIKTNLVSTPMLGVGRVATRHRHLASQAQRIIDDGVRVLLLLLLLRPGRTSTEKDDRDFCLRFRSFLDWANLICCSLSPLAHILLSVFVSLYLHLLEFAFVFLLHYISQVVCCFVSSILAVSGCIVSHLCCCSGVCIFRLPYISEYITRRAVEEPCAVHL